LFKLAHWGAAELFSRHYFGQVLSSLLAPAQGRPAEFPIRQLDDNSRAPERKEFIMDRKLLLYAALLGMAVTWAMAEPTDVREPTTLVAQWGLQGAGGDKVSDTSGNTYHGILEGDPAPVSGKSGLALRFDGVDDYVDVPGTERLNLTPGLALEAWVRFTAHNADSVIIGKHTSGTAGGYTLGVRDDKFIFYLNDGGPRTLGTSDTYNDGLWHYVVGIYDGAVQHLYVDDVLQDYQENTYTLFSTANIRIGGVFAGASDAAFIGDIDEVKIRDYAVPGDADRNGLVDDDDLAILLSNWTGPFGTGRTWQTGDFDRDGNAADDDLSMLLSNWTRPPPAGAAVPEPATLSLLALGSLAVVRKPRRGESILPGA